MNQSFFCFMTLTEVFLRIVFSNFYSHHDFFKDIFKTKFLFEWTEMDLKCAEWSQKRSQNFDVNMHHDSARQSFCSNAFKAGMAIKHIMAIRGHKSERVFLNYVKVEKAENAKRIAEDVFFYLIINHFSKDDYFQSRK